MGTPIAKVVGMTLTARLALRLIVWLMKRYHLSAVYTPPYILDAAMPIVAGLRGLGDDRYQRENAYSTLIAMFPNEPRRHLSIAIELAVERIT